MPTVLCPKLLVRHEADSPAEHSTCGWRYRLLSKEDQEQAVAWVHAVDIDGAKLHYHRISTELYYVLDGEGSVILDGVDQPVRKGSLLQIPPGVVHGARGRMRVLVLGVPHMRDDDLYFPDERNTADSSCP